MIKQNAPDNKIWNVLHLLIILVDPHRENWNCIFECLEDLCDQLDELNIESMSHYNLTFYSQLYSWYTVVPIHSSAPT